jgi:hypothetical protein
LVDLDENAQVEVLLAAKEANVLTTLASSSKQLCRLARSRVPVQLRISTQEHAELVIRSDASGRPPWSACTRLTVAVYNPATGLAAVGALNAAQRWTALQHVNLNLQLEAEQLQPSHTLDSCNAGILGALPALKGLRGLQLRAAVVGVCSARQLARLVHLTRLELGTPGAAAAAAAPADLSALSGMTSLVELVLSGLHAVQPAAGGAGPFCFPSSLTFLDILDPCRNSAGPECITRCLTHLPGCPALQELRVRSWPSQDQHPSASASAWVGLLAQHNTQLRRLEMGLGSIDVRVSLGLQLPGALADRQWRPDASLAALKGLASLDAGQRLQVVDQGDWQHLAQLTALTKVETIYFLCAPPRAAGLTLAVLDLEKCWVLLGGYDLGRILLACPGLQHAHVRLLEEALAAVLPGGEQLTPHPSLQSLEVALCSNWGPAAAAHWAALAPVVAGVSSLTFDAWPSSATNQPRGGLPDLSPCTALEELRLGWHRSAVADQVCWPEQEDFLLMLAPLVQLRYVEVLQALRLNARVALVLQTMLPKLQKLKLLHCGGLLPLAAAGAGEQEEEEVLGKVKKLLRPGLLLINMAW